MEKRKVILDVDTGSDDAIALIAAMANPAFEVLGIMAVNGNRAVEITTENSLRISELMGGTVPVFRGCALPWTSCMLGFRRHYPMYQAPEESLYKNIHGTYIDQCPPASIQAQPQNAVSWLVETLMAAEDGEITLIPLGPLTNIAHAVRIEPRIIPKIREIVYMGGGFRVGNKSALAEFNVWLDPEAAQAVLDCGIPFTFVTLDATHSAYVTLEDAARFRAIGTRPAQVVADLCEQRIAGYGEWQKVADVPAAPVHDPLTVAYLVDPSVITELV
ncbi:MAG: nucleoside hydrolase, partial [Clostridiales bacterium]|nr:nucleoside hydrolase [Clostridiales bacterium]